MRLSIFLFVILLPFTLFAQQRRTVSGYITDEQTGERLSAATVYEQNSGLGTIANQYGFYSLSVPVGAVSLKFSYVGYKSTINSLQLTKDQTISCTLNSDNKLSEVAINANNTKGTISDNIHGHERISMATIEKLPGFLGEKDVMKSLMILPGVKQGQEGSAGIFVRGGSPDQNLILLDGVPIYNATHLFGFVSVFTPEALQSVDFYKGGFPARFGGRLSSVVDVRMKEGNKYERHTDLTFGLLTSKITQEGPIKKGKSSYLISGRRTLLDLVATGIGKINRKSNEESIVPGLNFYDLNAKLNFKLNSRNHLYLSLYNGGDRLFSDFMIKNNYTDGITKEQTKVNLQWGNTVAAIRLNSQLSNKLFLNTSVSAGFFKYKINNRFNQNTTKNNESTETWADINYLTKVNTNNLKLEFDWYQRENHRIKFGAATSLNYFIPGEQHIRKNEGNELFQGNQHVSTQDASAFIEDDFSFHNFWKINLGLRYDLYKSDQKITQNLSPRLSVNLVPSNRTQISLSYAKMVQPIHLLTNSSIGLPSDIWVPATGNIPPEKSNLFALGGKFQINDRFWIESDAYYKTMRNVIKYNAGYSFLDISNDWETLVALGKGRAWGIENSFKYDTDKIKTWLNYTLSWNQRSFSEVNKGKYFPYKFDRRHDFNLGVIWNITKKIDFSAIWTYQSGQAATIAVQDYAGFPKVLDYSIHDFITGIKIDDPNRIQDISEISNYRLPAYHHLDINFTFKKQNSRRRSEWNLGVFNVYARQNPYMYYPYTQSNGMRRYKQISIFPFLPSVSYRIIF